MKVLVVLLALAVAASAYPAQYYETPVMKYYGEPEEFVSHVDKPATHYASGGYRLITAGQYDLPYDFHGYGSSHDISGLDYPSYHSPALPQLNWQKI